MFGVSTTKISKKSENVVSFSLVSFFIRLSTLIVKF
jgi:hypothetical protein